MKSIIALCIILLVSQPDLLAQNTGYTKELVNQIANTGSNFIEVPSTFSENEISKNKIDQALQGKTIEKIELIYTQFKLNPEFDQVKLNNDRIAELQKIVPATKNNGIGWVWVEQTGAKTVEDARNYYHGFRIYYSDPSHNMMTEKSINQEKFHRYQFEDNANQPTQYVVNNSEGGDIKHPSGTVIHVPAYCVLTPDGKPVVGSYTIAYTEFRDAAQIAYSGIPMEYAENGEKFNFNSVGMYELRGTQNNQELSLAKPITVDFKSNEVAEEVGFYEMDDQTGEWVKKHEVIYPDDVSTDTDLASMNQIPVNPFNKKTRGGVAVGVVGFRVGFPWGKAARFAPPTASDKNPNRKLKELTLTKPMMEKYLDLQKTDKTFIDKVVIKDNPELMQVTINEYNEEVFTNKIMGIEPIVLNPTMMTSEYSAAGHTFPSMVTGLSSPNFGVYNCDQIQRIRNHVTASPTYEMNGSSAKQFEVACVIDKDVNGSFSFMPKYLTYNKLANTTILLFDASGKLFAVTNEEVKKSDGSTNPKFEVVDLSAIVRDSKELKDYLKL